MKINKLLLAPSTLVLTQFALAQTFTNTAKQSDSFVDSIGVNIHLNYTNTPYGNFTGILLPAFSWSGIRHVRDGAVTTWVPLNSNIYIYQDMRALAAVGVKFNLTTSTTTVASVLPELSSWTAGSLESFEGLNEPDLSGDPNWVLDTTTWQSTLWNTVQSNSSLHGVGVLGTTPGYGDVAALGSLSAYCTNANMHPYTGGNPPLSELAFNELITDIDAPGRPIVATEAGFHNALQAPYGNGVQPPVDELTGAKYDLRLYLGMFNAGIVRTYIYELLDEDVWGPESTAPESSFGLIRGDGSYKPAFTAIGNLIHLTQDPGPAFTPSPFTYTLSGADANTNTTLLAKRNGSYVMAIWEEVPSWNIVTRKDIAVPITPIKITFGGRKMTGQFYNQLSKTASPQGTFTKATSLQISANDVVTILTLTPQN